jgi:hypothetical protein
MAIRLYAEYTGHGILLSRIETQDDADSVRTFFTERGLAATVGPLSFPGDYRVFLPETTMERFAALAEDWNIECEILDLRQRISESKERDDADRERLKRD